MYSSKSDACRFRAIATKLTPNDIENLENGEPVLVPGFSLVMPSDLQEIEAACPGWRGHKTTQCSSKIEEKIISFPFWEDDSRGTPRCILRSSLFGVVRRGKRKAFDHKEIASVANSKIFFTGIQLDQFDLDVYLQCLHLFRGTKDPSKPIKISEKSFLKAMGRASGKTDRIRLRKSLFRLNSGSVQIEIKLEKGRIGYSGTLIEKYTFYEDEKGYRKSFVKINPELAKLFDNGLWVSIDWGTRIAFKGYPLAQWLHAFYSTHENPHPYKVDTIRKMCGSDIKNLYDFRAKLKKAIKSISTSTGWKMWIDENDCLNVIRC